jgi:hypothetical protein
MPPDPTVSRSPALRRLALLSTALLACTTVRTPVSTIGDQVPLRGGQPEPQVELWVESDRPLSPAEEVRARSEARQALSRALEGREQPDGDALLVVRAQGVTRTPGHRRDQTAATAGLVVGAVVVVAAVVVALVYSGKGGGHGHSPGRPSIAAGGGHGLGRAAGHAPGALSVGAPRGAFRPALPAPHRPFLPAPVPGFRSVPAPGFHPWHAGPAVDVDVGFWWVLPLEPAEEPAPYGWAPPLTLPDAPPEQGQEQADSGRWDEELAAPAPLPLPPPPRLPVEERGFFAGDRLSLEAVVVDRESGETLWVKRLDTKADPCEARAVRAAVDRLLAPGGWLPPSPDGN